MFTPTTSPTPFERCFRNPESFDPLRKTKGDSIMGDVYILSGVTDLCPLGSPTAIAGLIPTGIIDPINREKSTPIVTTWGAGPHVSQEVLEVSPTITDGDTSPSIIFEAGCVGIQTSLQHASPCLILTGLGFSVGRASFTRTFPVQAPATLACTRTEICTGDDPFIPADTFAQPCGMAGNFSLATDHKETSKLLSGEIDKSWHLSQGTKVLID